jgi:hypothetical protein
MIVIGWKSCLLWTAHTPCGVNSLRKSNQIKSLFLNTPCGVNSLRKSNQIKSNQIFIFEE